MLILRISSTYGVSKGKRSPSGYLLPSGRSEGGSQGESLHGFGVCGGKGGGKQPPRVAVESLATAFTFKCGSLAARANGAWGVGKSVDGSSGNSLAAKGGNEGCLSGRLCRLRRASTAFYIGPGKAQPMESVTIGLSPNRQRKQRNWRIGRDRDGISRGHRILCHLSILFPWPG